MAFQYALLPGHRLAVLVFFGTVTGDDILAATQVLHSDPGWQPGFRKLVDARGIAELDVQIDEIKQLTEVVTEEVAGPGALAIVQNRWLVRVIADLISHLLPFRRPRQVFDRLPPALAWLELPDTFDPAHVVGAGRDRNGQGAPESA